MCLDDKVSIIMPVYNCEKYIERALNSILCQTYENFEVIIVDDGSEDSSGSICKKFSEKDCRVRYFYKENGGVARARNMALKHITGNLIAFVDADDCIEQAFLERMVTIKKNYNAQIVICDFKRFSDNENDTKQKGSGQIQEWEHNDLMINCYGQFGSIVCGVLWNKIYDADLFTDLEFLVDFRNEDEYIIPRLFDRCNKAVYLDEVLYNYYVNSNSITTNSEYLLSTDIYKVYDDRISYFSKKGKEYEEFVRLTKKEYLDRIISRYRKTKSKELRKLYKVKYDLFKDSVGIGYKIYRISPQVYYGLVKITGK